MIDEMLSEQLDSTSKRPRLDSPESVEVGALRSMLECPVCYAMMLPPINQCAQGHPICSAWMVS